MENKIECPLCEKLTGVFTKEIANGNTIEKEYVCKECGVVFSKAVYK